DLQRQPVAGRDLADQRFVRIVPSRPRPVGGKKGVDAGGVVAHWQLPCLFCLRLPMALAGWRPPMCEPHHKDANLRFTAGSIPVICKLLRASDFHREGSYACDYPPSSAGTSRGVKKLKNQARKRVMSGWITRAALLAAALGLLAATTAGARAQTFPSGTVNLIVPLPPCRVTHIIPRTVAH